MADNTEQQQINQLLEEIQAEWSNVHICYRGPEYYDGKECTIRNTTDEGLPANVEEKEVRGTTLTETIKKAHEKYVTD